MKVKLISVIVTTYNEPAMLELVLYALSHQQQPGEFEVVVADDGSTDATKELITQWQQRANYPLKHTWQEDSGFRAAASRNRAIAESSGDYIVFLDGDCLPQASFVNRHRSLARARCFVVGHRALLAEKFTQKLLADASHYPQTIWQLLQLRLQGNINKLLSLCGLPLGPLRMRCAQGWKGAKTCNLAVWRDDLATVNGFDESYVGWGYEDSDLVIRLLRAGVARRSGRYAVSVMHCYHQQASRDRESENWGRLMELLDSDRVQASIGLDS